MRQVRTRTSPEQQETAILKAAAEQVALVGVGRLSLDVVARRAGVSRSTLYRRFPSRDALLTELGHRTVAFAMSRLATVDVDSGPREAAVSGFCEGVRILTTEPTMRRFLQLDGDTTMSPGMREAAEKFLERASATMAKALRAAGATMADPDLLAVAELHIRLATSLAQINSRVLDTADTAAVRLYAQRHLSQLVY
ncbi:helix-turn-helix domain-containing protein [Mycolicibacterium sp. 624]|uniref:TetR/AcrR family transcriptional regulator n=1 Tax=Mycolicibacterium sp. 624 TaxID=3156314 RepID=UPI0033996102